MEIDDKKLSPMMQKYKQTKQEYEDCLLLYRLGDFYEMFFEDAKTASKALDIALTARNCGNGLKAPMCGVPYHAVDTYISKLLEKGLKVAICDQVGDVVKGQIVDREVTRVITPGTIIESEILEGKSSNYILCLTKKGESIGLSFCDVSTGEFKVNQFDNNIIQRCSDLFVRLKPSEIICNQEMHEFSLECKEFKVLDFLPPFTRLGDYSFDEGNAEDIIKKQFNMDSIKGHDFFLLKQAICSIGALIDYLTSTQKRALTHINKIITEHDSEYMHLDFNTTKNLELIENVKDKKKKGSLFWSLNKTKTAMGSRLLEKWILQPLQDSKEINKRLDCVEELYSNQILLNDITTSLDSISDIARVCSKISYGTIMPKDCVSLKNSLFNVVDLCNISKDLNHECFKNLFLDIDSIKNIAELLEKAFIEQSPNILANGGYIKEDFNTELYELKNISTEAKKWLNELEVKEREETGIKNLKIGYSRVFGYFIEINKSQESLVPYRYVRKQTISNHERFVTEELKAIEEKLLNSQELALKLELTIFNKIKEQLKELVPFIQAVANDVAFLDVIASFSTVSQSNQYVKPKISNKIKHIKLKDSRHPIVELNLKNESFVSNDVYLDEGDDRAMIITGPNMAGKSTYMRQIALITIMAHIGCFVPCSSAEMGIVDRVFTRIGASDDLNSGQSTFMVEMIEVSNILNNATNKSLVLLDEVGRGTATYDGMSIAWAVLEYISQAIKCKTLFSTHYHEITTLEGKLEGIKNYKVNVKEFNNSIIFLRKVTRGCADRSFGIEVAALSGIYESIIKRAKSILNLLEKNSVKIELAKIENSQELPQIDKENIINMLKNIDMNIVSPMEAFEILMDLTKKVK